MEPWFRAGLGYLARIVEFPGRSVVLTTPYALLSSEAEWREYFVRQLGTSEKDAAGGKGGASRDKKNGKKARRAPAGAADSPAQRLHRHMKRGPSPDHWLEFVEQAFEGTVNRCPALAGVPDLPETIPRSPEFDEEGDHPWLEVLDGDVDGPDPRVADVPLAVRIQVACKMAAGETPRSEDPPLLRLRRLLGEQVEAETLHEEAAEDCERVCRTLGADTIGLDHPGVYQLLAAYAFFGLPGKRRKSALERLLDSGRLDDEERALAEKHRGVRFSLFGVLAVIPDEGFEVNDLLQRRKLRIRERLLTRQVVAGTILAAWLLEGEEPLTFEGSLYPMSFDSGMQVLEGLRPLRPAERRLAPTAIAVIDSVIARVIAPSKGVQGAPLPASPELEAALVPVVLDQIRRAMRGPIPMFGNQSLVELVQTERGREQARAWLVEQEQTLRSQPQLAGISLEPLWKELGLDYEG